MSDDDETNGIGALERLDRALDRIEAGARPSATAVPAPTPDLTEVAARLDAVIARLRAELEA